MSLFSLPSQLPRLSRSDASLPFQPSQWNDDAEDNHQPVLGVTRLGGRHQLNETEFDAQLIGSLASVGLTFVPPSLFLSLSRIRTDWQPFEQ